MKKFYFMIILFFSTSIFAAEKFPALCQISGIHFGKGAVLFYAQHTAKPRLYAIKNKSDKAIWLTHQKKNPSASAGWDTQIMPNHWSVILVTERNFDLQCHFQTKSEGMKDVPCKKFLNVCQFNDFSSKHPIEGGYWVVENVLFPALEPRMHARGFES